MTLKADFLDGLNGFTTQMANTYAAGKAWVATNSATISTDLKANAALGKTIFVLEYATTYNTVALRLKGTFLDTYFEGIQTALAEEGIYSYECSLELNDNEDNVTKVTMTFEF